MCGCGCGGGEEKKKAPQVGEIDSTKKNSPIVEGPVQNEAAECAKGPRFCWFNGRQYTRGAAVCSGGVLLRCFSNGSWGRVGRC